MPWRGQRPTTMSAPSPTPAITAPTQPRRHRAVTIIPLRSTPKQIDGRASLNLIPSRKAAIEPVQTPVTGKGMATKSTSPIRPYLSISPARRLARLNIFSTAFPMMPILAENRLRRSREKSRKGTGRMLPTRAMGRAKYQWIWNTFIATGSAPLSSDTGSIEMINTIRGFEIPRLTKSSTTISSWIKYQ